MAHPVAMIPYANMAPYREAGCPSGCRFVPLVPSASVDAIRTGKVLAAALPVAALPALGDAVRPVGCFGIAAAEASMSVLVFSDRPFDTLGASDAVALTRESTTSARLLRVLLETPTGSGPVPARRPEGPARAELLIGDRALIGRYHWRQGRAEQAEHRRLSTFDHVADLATEWYRRHGLPFVFARWVVRRDAPTDCKKSIEAWLERFRAREAAWVARAVPGTARQTRLPEDLITRYFEAIRRTLTPEDTAGQERFIEALRRLAPPPRPRCCRPSATAA